MNLHRHRGYSYVQVLIIMMSLPMLFVIMDKMFQEMTLDLPVSSQVASQNERLLRCLEFVEQDLAEAVALPGVFGTWQQDANTLLIQLPDELVAYVCTEGGVARHRIDPNDTEAKRFWPIPLARVVWAVNSDASRPGRVEVATGVLHKRRKKQQLKNTRLFYAGVGSTRGGGL